MFLLIESSSYHEEVSQGDATCNSDLIISGLFLGEHHTLPRGVGQRHVGSHAINDLVLFINH